MIANQPGNNSLMTLPMPTAAVVLSGNELLDGRTRDTNGRFLCSDLSARGVKVTSLQLVADDARRLEAALRFSLDAHPDLLLVGGGLGTTHDDLTAACLAHVLGVRLEEHPEALRMLEARVRELALRRHLDFGVVFALARRQAVLPVGSRPVSPAGVAPGIAARQGPTRIFAFPGVPFELEAMWQGVARSLHGEGFFPDVVQRVIRVFGVGELQVAPILETSPRDLLETGINVGGGEVAVTLRYRREPAAEAQAVGLVAALVAGAPVFSTDGRSVDDLVADRLRAAGATLAVAESCTGGLLGARLTERAGSSDYFLGGVISYTNQVKMNQLQVPAGLLAKHGAVSEEVAGAMAEGVRTATGADYALAVSGVAGPAGGTIAKPVGLVYIGCAAAHGTRVVHGLFPGDRASVRVFSTTSALHLLLRELVHERR
jgi:nicotinamide-nucleotide amidase